MTLTDLETKLRKSVKNVYSCNVLDLENSQLRKSDYDVITCMFCLFCACRNEEQYRRACKSIQELVKPGGHLYIHEAFGETHYQVHFYFLLFPLDDDCGIICTSTETTVRPLRWQRNLWNDHFQVGDEKFHSLKLSKEAVKSAYQNAGFSKVDFKVWIYCFVVRFSFSA